MVNYEARTRRLIAFGYLLSVGVPLAVVAVWVAQTGAVGAAGAVTLLITAFIGGFALHSPEWVSSAPRPQRAPRREAAPGGVRTCRHAAN